MTQLGRMIAPGRTSDVYEFGRGSVVKVPRPDVPAGWAAIEAEITAAVHRNGLPTPAVRGVEVVEGRESAVFERIDGQSMWEQVRNGERDVPSAAVELAEIQLAIHRAHAPSSLLEVRDRVGAKINAASVLLATERDEAQRILACLPRGSSLCHGDLHPGNVLMSGRGPIVIDWYDAAAGSPIADFVRSSLLIRPSVGGTGVLHLPESSNAVLRRFHASYVTRMLDDLDVDLEVARSWEAVLAAARLSEQAEPDDSCLLALWRGRAGDTASPLLEDISAIR